jgi:RNA polymerase sigma-70 factor, ECF subfamily
MPLELESGHQAPDRDLVRLIAGGDAQALAELRLRHDNTLYAVAYGLLADAIDAAHVVSETFLEASRSAAQFDPDRTRVPAWLSGIVRHRAHDILRTRAPLGATGA